MKRLIGWLCAMSLLVGCAGREFIARGDELLERGRYQEAIRAYEQALQVSPGNGAAEDGRRNARRQAVQEELDKGQDAISRKDYAGALRRALTARKMPLDLDEVELKRAIDRMISSAAKEAEKRVDQLIARNHLYEAAMVAEEIVLASPGVSSREEWAASIRAQAVTFYQDRASKAHEANLHGAEALSLAMGAQLEEVKPTKAVQEAWAHFTKVGAVGIPSLKFLPGSDVEIPDEELLLKLGTNVGDALVQRLPVMKDGGVIPAFTVSIEELKFDTTVEQTKVPYPYPGVRVQLRERYLEDVTFRELVDVTEMQTRIEKREMRDCAPRPGKARGCRTWVEDVEVKVPVEVKREVERVRQEERERFKQDLPNDKVLYVDADLVTQAWTLAGSWTLEGDISNAQAFRIELKKSDYRHEAVETDRLTVLEDVDDLSTPIAMTADISKELEVRLAAGWDEARDAWFVKSQNKLLALSNDEQWLEAQDIALAMLARGLVPDRSMERFFYNAFGQPAARTVLPLVDALDLRTGPLAALTDGMSSNAGIPRRPKMPSVEDTATLKSKAEIVKPAIPVVEEGDVPIDDEDALEVDPDSQEDVEAFLSEDDTEADELEDNEEDSDSQTGTDESEVE